MCLIFCACVFCFFDFLALQFKKSVVDKLTERSRLPFSRIGIEWKGSSATGRPGFVRRIDLTGMKSPDNYFEIFLSEEAVQQERSGEGMFWEGIYVHTLCKCVESLVQILPQSEKFLPYKFHKRNVCVIFLYNLTAF